jgi:hypothetical protein
MAHPVLNCFTVENGVKLRKPRTLRVVMDGRFQYGPFQEANGVT